MSDHKPIWTMMRFAIVVCAVATSPLATSSAYGNQDGVVPAQKQPAGKNLADVVELLEDGADFLIENLDNGGNRDGSVASRNEQSVFSGKSSLIVTPFHRFRPGMPGWQYPIKEIPEPGEFRYVRFAWKRTEAPGILLQFFTRTNQWEGFYAGSLSRQVKRPMIKLAEEPPRKWELVTRDLFKDFGPITIIGINFSAMEGGGEAHFDHIYLARTVEDLDRVTQRMTKGVEPEAPKQADTASGSIPWPQLIAVLAAVLVLFITGLLLILVMRRGGKARHDAATAGAGQGKVVTLACRACGKKLKAKAQPGKSVTCPQCGASIAVPEHEATP
jgi:DNA-directed RNA polymerase subunit RPC12/RpoP